MCMLQELKEKMPILERQFQEAYRRLEHRSRERERDHRRRSNSRRN